jgi:hypothetical protein
MTAFVGGRTGLLRARTAVLPPTKAGVARRNAVLAGRGDGVAKRTAVVSR